MVRLNLCETSLRFLGTIGQLQMQNTVPCKLDLAREDARVRTARVRR